MVHKRKQNRGNCNKQKAIKNTAAHHLLTLLTKSAANVVVSHQHSQETRLETEHPV